MIKKREHASSFQMRLSTETEPGGSPSFCMSRIRWGGGEQGTGRETPCGVLVFDHQSRQPRPASRLFSRERDLHSTTLLLVGCQGCFGRVQLLFSPRFAEYWLIVDCMWWSLDLAPWVSLGIAQQESSTTLTNMTPENIRAGSCSSYLQITQLHYNRLP